MDVHMHVTILPFRLRVLKVKKEHIPNICHAVSKLLLCPDTHLFFSFTETDEGVSLVLDEEGVNNLLLQDPLAKDVVQVCDILWRPVQLAEGSLGFTSVGIVHALSEPLAKAGITIFNLTTYQTDFTLVPDDRILDAVHCLKERFSIMTEGLDELTHGANILRITPPSANNNSNNGSLLHHGLLLPPYELYLCSMKKEYMLAQAANILKAMFFPSRHNRFFSYTETEDEISLLLDRETMDMFPDEELLKTGDAWKLVKVDGDLGFAETGIVHAMTETISFKGHISVFYVSTFVTDYVLIPVDSFDEAVELLKHDQRFTVAAE